MTVRKQGYRAAAIVAGLCLGLAACGGGGGSGDGEPQQGGILKVLGGGDVDSLDPVGSYYTVTSTLGRTWTRQLISYKASNDFEEAIQPQGDVAAEVPTKENGGISEDGKTYTFNLRRGIMWDTEPPRELVAEDVIRGFERLCNPAQPVGNKAYFNSTIVGFKDYCDGYDDVDADSAEDMADYQNSNDIEGISAPDDYTVEIELRQPTIDFVNIVSMNFVSPAPEEYEDYVPNSREFQQNTVSNGPYRITEYTPDKSIKLERNDNWNKESDPLRNQYVDGIEVTMGQDNGDVIQQQIEAGSVHLAWDVPPPTTQLPQLAAQGEDGGLSVHETPNTNPYLAFNFRSQNEDSAVSKLKVRQAINYAIDKTAVGKVYGGPEYNTPLNQIIPPGNAGHQPYNLYPTPDNSGNVNECKRLLAEAGYEDGLTLKYPYRSQGAHPQVTQSVAANLKACGITTELEKTTPDGFYSDVIQDVEAGENGDWDIAAPGWIPDWFGNNGRSLVQPLFDSRTCGQGSTNYGCYDNPEVDALIDKALAAETEDEAAQFWHQADRRIMQDAAIVPFQSQKTPLTQADSVEGAKFLPKTQYFDYTNLWLTDG